MFERVQKYAPPNTFNTNFEQMFALDMVNSFY